MPFWAGSAALLCRHSELSFCARLHRRLCAACMIKPWRTPSLTVPLTKWRCSPELSSPRSSTEEMGLNVTVFGFDTGEQLTEHQAARAAVVQVLSGRLRFVVDGEELDLANGSWLHMAPGAPHALVATEPTVMLLTLFGS